jgi:hypothetical protein
MPALTPSPSALTAFAAGLMLLATTWGAPSALAQGAAPPPQDHELATSPSFSCLSEGVQSKPDSLLNTMNLQWHEILPATTTGYVDNHRKITMNINAGTMAGMPTEGRLRSACRAQSLYCAAPPTHAFRSY